MNLTFIMHYARFHVFKAILHTYVNQLLTCQIYINLFFYVGSYLTALNFEARDDRERGSRRLCITITERAGKHSSASGIEDDKNGVGVEHADSHNNNVPACLSDFTS